MRNKAQVKYLQDFVSGVYCYYIQCNQASVGHFSIPVSMVKYALSNIDERQARLLLDSLVQSKDILSVDDQKIVFSQHFLASPTSEA
jgi:hypothetical protein